MRKLVILFVVVGVFATACTEESRDNVREALPSGVSGLPSALLSPGLSQGPTCGEPGDPTGPTRAGHRPRGRDGSDERGRRTDRGDRGDSFGRR